MYERTFMNHAYLDAICAHFSLGIPQKRPQKVLGGLLHTMWRVDTDKGAYAVKQLSPSIDLTNPQVIQRYEISEQTAAYYKQHGIPAVVALEKDSKHLFVVDGVGFLVYPWVNAKALDPHTVSESHALKIAELLARMHKLNPPRPLCSEPASIGYTQEHVNSWIYALERMGSSVVQRLKDSLHHLMGARDEYHAALPTLKEHEVVGHADLDQKNVLWDEHDNPIIVDWESVAMINPTYDMVNTALDWSGIGANFNKELFMSMVNTYHKASGLLNKDHLEAALNGALSRVGWLMYITQRASQEDNATRKDDHAEHINEALAALVRLRVLIPDLLENLLDYMTDIGD